MIRRFKKNYDDYDKEIQKVDYHDMSCQFYDNLWIVRTRENCSDFIDPLNRL